MQISIITGKESMFVGREKELGKLEELYAKGDFQMVVLYGRRRVGKTTLVKEFACGKNALYFTALEQSDHDNLADFTRKLMGFFDLPTLSGSFSGWAEALGFFADRAGRRACRPGVRRVPVRRRTQQVTPLDTADGHRP